MIAVLAGFDRAVAELALFAAVVILLGGIDDLFMDMVWWRVRQREPNRAAVLPAPPLPLAVFVPARFVRWRDVAGGRLIATRAFFPDTIDTAVRQKARWVAGIALSGWDRTGWGPRRHGAEYWMRMRDRRGLLAVAALVAAYLALVGWGMSSLGHALLGDVAVAVGAGLRVLLMLNTGLLCWRLGARAMHTAAEHGWREGCWSLPRAAVANYIAMLAARRALWRYVATLLGAAPRWDKTAHRFPDHLPDAS